MNIPTKRKDVMGGKETGKRPKMQCPYGDKCFRLNPIHFKEYSHEHLESILDSYTGSGDFPIPSKLFSQKQMYVDQLKMIIHKQLYTPGKNFESKQGCSKSPVPKKDKNPEQKSTEDKNTKAKVISRLLVKQKEKSKSPEFRRGGSSQSPDFRRRGSSKSPDFRTGGSRKSSDFRTGEASKSPDFRRGGSSKSPDFRRGEPSKSSDFRRGGSSKSPDFRTGGSRQSPDFRRGESSKSPDFRRGVSSKSPDFRRGGSSKSPETRKGDSSKMQGSKRGESSKASSNARDSDYRPIVQPTRRVEDFLSVVRPKGNMAAKHAASAPYHIFYTTITDSKETHEQPYSITFQEILDHSLGELKCSLQINFMVEIGWLLAQYYFAGYSQKKLMILYGEDCSDLKDINRKKPQVEAHYVTMSTPFGKHHTKMMVLCYEDGSLRVVISTANLYLDDWENRTQGLWFSPSCPELPVEAMPHEGESPTLFKKSLLRYLNHYQLPQLAFYIDRIKRCDFSHINVFLVASVPGSHFDQDWGMTRMGSLLRQHCCIPADDTRQWPLIAQASSIGSYGKDPTLWLTGDFLHNFTKNKNQSQLWSVPPELKIVYPSLENVRQSHDNLLGGGCLPYGADAHSKQEWLNAFLYQWRAESTKRNRAMPHIKSYTRVLNNKAAFYLLTSANISKAAWGQINKGNGAIRIMSYEAGVLFLPQFLIKGDYFPLDQNDKNRIIIPYDLPPVKYTPEMKVWVQDYLR